MCGRYIFITDDGNIEISWITDAIEKRYGKGMFSGGEMFPGTDVPVIVASYEHVDAVLAHWGIPSYDGKREVINARCEGLTGKPMFKDSFINGRCLVPASGFFEWSANKQKYLFTDDADNLVYMAGIILKREDKDCLAILTTTANDSVKGTHSRMPLVLDECYREDWLFDAAAAKELLKITPSNLKKQKKMAAYSRHFLYKQFLFKLLFYFPVAFKYQTNHCKYGAYDQNIQRPCEFNLLYKMLR